MKYRWEDGVRGLVRICTVVNDAKMTIFPNRILTFYCR